MRSLRWFWRFYKKSIAAEFPKVKNFKSINEVIRDATYPEISGKSDVDCHTWFEGYITTILQSDVRFIAKIDKIGILPIMLRVLASRAGSLVNDADIARSVGLNAVTSKSYRAILQAMFLCFDVLPWYRNIGKRLTKSPKCYLGDTFLLSHLLDWNLDDLQSRRPDLYGHVVENFVATELLKLLSFSQERANLFHFRTSDDKEVDFVLEKVNGYIAGIEVKSASRVALSDFKGLKVLQELVGDDFKCGVVLYNGREVVPFGDKLFAVPVASLWH